jgi:hypothetical protein
MQEHPDSMQYLVNDHLARRQAQAEARRARVGTGSSPRQARRRMWQLLSMGARA